MPSATERRRQRPNRERQQAVDHYIPRPIPCILAIWILLLTTGCILAQPPSIVAYHRQALFSISFTWLQRLAASIRLGVIHMWPKVLELGHRVKNSSSRGIMNAVSSMSQYTTDASQEPRSMSVILTSHPYHWRNLFPLVFITSMAVLWRAHRTNGSTTTWRMVLQRALFYSVVFVLGVASIVLIRWDLKLQSETMMDWTRLMSGKMITWLWEIKINWTKFISGKMITWLWEFKINWTKFISGNISVWSRGWLSEKSANLQLAEPG